MNSRIFIPIFHDLISPRHGMEVKFSEAPEITRSMQTALHDLDLTHLWVVYPGADAYQVEKKISVLPLQKILELVHQL